jgi:hypothetical protein
MTWLTWRQFRAQTIAAAAALAILAVLLAATGPHLASLYASSGMPSCHAHSDCGTAASNFVNQLKSGTLYEVLFYLCLAVMFLAPAVAGVFWGAPLITRETEAGTLGLAWSQSVTRHAAVGPAASHHARRHHGGGQSSAPQRPDDQ